MFMDSCYVLIAATMDLLLSNNHIWVRWFLGYNVANYPTELKEKTVKSLNRSHLSGEKNV